MRKLMVVSTCALAALLAWRSDRGQVHASAVPKDGPAYSDQGELKLPKQYREWIFLSSGVGMTYGPAAATSQNRPKMFDNVFVNPDAYRAFLNTGQWPDKTMFVLEIRNSETSGSINKGGYFQTDVTAIEVEVKDSGNPAGLWSFYDFPVRNGAPATVAKAIPADSSCHTCHTKSGAVEQTFVQFYPQLLAVARAKGTVNKGFEGLPLNMTELEALVNRSEWAEVQQALEGTRQMSPEATALYEGPLTSLAARLARGGKSALAAKLLSWACARYPKSANLQHSLAEASLLAGDKDGARTATEAALALLGADASLSPDARNAIEKAAEKRRSQLQ